MSLQHEKVLLCRNNMRGSCCVVTTGKGRVCVVTTGEGRVCVVTT